VGGRDATAPPPETRVDAPTWSKFWREHALAAVVLFVLALVVRASLLVQIGLTPFFQVRNIDSEPYHQWALRIAAGHWMPTDAFYQSPLYAYFLGTLYALFGGETRSPRVVQAVLGSVSPLLVYAVGATLFSRTVGWLAGIGLALLVPTFINMMAYFRTGFQAGPGTLSDGGTIAYAQGEPVSDRTDPYGARGTRSAGSAVYVIVSRRCPGEAGVARRPGRGQ
jgi:hypothetical protein